MRKSKLQFWLKCPECGSRFGIQPELVLKYLDRLVSELKKLCEGSEDRKQKGTDR